MTTVYFLRHAEAYPLQFNQTDADRALTPKGKAQATAVGVCCGKLNIFPNRLWTSPYRRTLETAETMLQALSGFSQHLPHIEPVEWLAIGAYQNDMERWMQQRRLPKAVLLVSHEPNCSNMIAQMLGTNHTAINIKKASLTAISINTFPIGGGRLLWSLTPSLIKHIAE